MPTPSITKRVAAELSLSTQQVHGALALFEDGATLPFIARYRKEATGGLDEVQLRDVRDRAQYLTEKGIIGAARPLGEVSDVPDFQTE